MKHGHRFNSFPGFIRGLLLEASFEHLPSHGDFLGTRNVSTGTCLFCSVLDNYESQLFLVTKEPNNGNKHCKTGLEAFIDRDAKVFILPRRLECWLTFDTLSFVLRGYCG